MENNNKVTSSIFYRILPPISCSDREYKELLLEHSREILEISSLDYDTMFYGDHEYKTVWYPEADLEINGKISKVPMCRVIRITYSPGLLFGRYKKQETILELAIHKK